VSENYIIINKKIDEKEFFMAQNISFKKEFMAHINFHKFIGKDIPIYKTPKLSKPPFYYYFRIISYLPSYFSYKRYLWPIFYYIEKINRYFIKYGRAITLKLFYKNRRK